MQVSGERLGGYPLQAAEEGRYVYLDDSDKAKQLGLHTLSLGVSGSIIEVFLLLPGYR